MSFFHTVAMHLAAAAANADPVGPNANVANVNTVEWDEVKGWWGITWTNGDASAYIHITEDGGDTILETLSPGTTGYNDYWTSTEIFSGDIRIRATKNGISLAWVAAGA